MNKKNNFENQNMPYERFKRFGPEALTESELLAIILRTGTKGKPAIKMAEEIYEDLKKQGIEVLLDDRAERAGVKFKDADLIGIPVRITVGKKAAEGLVEYKLRKEENLSEISADDAVAQACAFIRAELA